MLIVQSYIAIIGIILDISEKVRFLIENQTSFFHHLDSI
jgi:hypothetical protein